MSGHALPLLAVWRWRTSADVVRSYASPDGRAVAKVYREQFGTEPERNGLAVRGRRLVPVLATATPSHPRHGRPRVRPHGLCWPRSHSRTPEAPRSCRRGASARSGPPSTPSRTIAAGAMRPVRRPASACVRYRFRRAARARCGSITAVLIDHIRAHCRNRGVDLLNSARTHARPPPARMASQTRTQRQPQYAPGDAHGRGGGPPPPCFGRRAVAIQRAAHGHAQPLVTPSRATVNQDSRASLSERHSAAHDRPRPTASTRARAVRRAVERVASVRLAPCRRPRRGRCAAERRRAAMRSRSGRFGP